MALQDHRDFVAALIRDDAEAVAPADVDRALAHAAARYSTHRPRVVVDDYRVASADGRIAWTAGWTVRAVEHPVGETPPAMRGRRAWRLHVRPGAVDLIVGGAAKGDTVRVTHAEAHVLAAFEDSVPAADRAAVGHWAAAELLDMLAARGAGSTDSTILADRVDRGAQADSYRRLARGHRDIYPGYLTVCGASASVI